MKFVWKFVYNGIKDKVDRGNLYIFYVEEEKIYYFF